MPTPTAAVPPFASRAPFPNFSISVGEGGNDEGIGGTADQGHTFSAAVSGTGSTADIGPESGALSAVSALAKAVESLGKAQAVVGKGQNQFGYAVNLAQSQLVQPRRRRITHP